MVKRPILGRTNRLHFVGVGGIGMSGIAEVLLNLGFTITGSDQQLSSITDRLTELGAKIYKGHSGEYVVGADVVVISSAIPPDNPEVLTARELKIPVIRRAEMLGELMRMKWGIAIAGTHGKTTTTSMVGMVLEKAGFDPTLIVGGRVKSLTTNARLGEGDYLVVEADEFDRSFLTLSPQIAVVTNIETEHLDCYRDLEEIKETFISFVSKVPFYSAVAVCLDEPSLQEIIPRIERRILTYGLNPQAEFRGIDVQFKELHSEFTVFWKDSILGQIHLQLPGLHNIKNSLAALCVGVELEIPFSTIKEALEEFTGVHRRFEIKSRAQNILIVDDYAHHPTEIKATLRAAREGWDRRIVAVFQPHLYSRTRDFYQEFGQSFFDADILLILDVYGAREKPIPGISGKMIADSAKAFGHRHVFYTPTQEDALDVLRKQIREGDIVITMGAGDVYKISDTLSRELISL